MEGVLKNVCGRRVGRRGMGRRRVVGRRGRMGRRMVKINIFMNPPSSL